MVSIWPRENYVTGGGPAQFALVALSSTRLADPLPISRSQHGMPNAEGANAVQLAVRERAQAPQWFADNVVEPFLELVAGDLGTAAVALCHNAEFGYIVSCDLHDPDDLSHVQAAWALAKCICEQGAAIVVDIAASRAHAGPAIAALAPDRSFDVMHDVTLLFDERGDGMVAWTAGMEKFGRPNLLIVDIDRDAAALAATILRDAAFALADGERLEIGDQLEIGNRGFIATALPADHGTSIDGLAVALTEIEVATSATPEGL